VGRLFGLGPNEGPVPGPGRSYLNKKPPTDGIWITINKSKRILTLYKNSIVLQKYPVAIG